MMHFRRPHLATGAALATALAGPPAAALAATLALALVPARAAAQQQAGTVRGTVSDSATGRPIAGVQITIVGSTRSALTNESGVYSVRGVPAGAVTVRAQRLGYAPRDRRVTVGADETVTADLVVPSVATTLSTIVSVGYGSSARAEVSSAIASIDSTSIARVPVASIDNAFQGKIAGVQVMQNAGEPGTGVSVRVRGPASLNAGNQPLYVVDGVPIIQGTVEQLTSTSGQRITPISGINPDDIATIDVLKDAAAAAIYGSRGSNGVVIITTKRGAAGDRMRFALSAYGGTQEVEKKIGLLNAQQYVQVMNESRTNEARPVLFAAGTDSVNYDWQDAIFRGAPISDVQLSMSGGSERARMFLSGANFAQRGIVIGSAYQRQAARLNLDANATSRLFVSASVGLTREDNDRVPGDLNVDGVVTNAVAMQPMTPIYGSSFGFGGTRENLLYSNPVAVATFNSLEMNTLRALGNVEARYSIGSRMTISGRAGGDVYGLDELRWRSPKIDRAAGASVGGQGSSGHTAVSRYLLEGFTNIDLLSSSRQRLAFTGGSSVEYNRSELNFVTGQGFPTGFDTYIRNAASINDFDGSATSNNLVSFFTRANYTLLDRYLVSASLRADGSSRFGTENRYGVFPAVSLGWTLTDEAFAQRLGRLATLKLRGSYGTTGNQGIGDFASRTLASGSAAYGGVAGLAGSQLGNPNLKWEQTQEVDLGLDLGLLDGRVSVIADWYDRNTSNLLVQRPVPATSGYTTVWDNVGEIRNRGVDLGLRTINVDAGSGRGLGWTTDFNVTWNRNLVTDLYRQPGDTATPTITATVSSRVTSVAAVGQPLGTFFVYKFLRVDPQTGNAIYAKAGGTETTTPTSSDLMFAGNPQPNYYGGLTNTLTYRGFDLRGFLQFSQGGKVLNLMRLFMDDGGNSRDNKSTNVLRRWQKPGDVTDVPRMGVNSGARLLSSRFIEDGSFVRLGELTLGYRLPARLTRLARTSDARLYVSGRNLATWSDYSGYNPDVNSSGAGSNVVMGVDYYAYPLARTVTLGLSAGW
jgi:TonB-linked SusC/RagA family outer membrane protein